MERLPTMHQDPEAYDQAVTLGTMAGRVLEQLTNKKAGNLDVQHAMHGKPDEFYVGFHVGNTDRNDPRADGVKFYIKTSANGSSLFIKYRSGPHELIKEFPGGPEDITENDLRQALDEALQKYKTSNIK